MARMRSSVLFFVILAGGGVIVGGGCVGSEAVDREDGGALPDVAISHGGVVGAGGVIGSGGTVGTGRAGGDTEARTPDASVPDAPGTGAVTGAGGVGGACGAAGAGAVAGAGTVTGAGGVIGAGGSLSIPLEQAEQYASCASNDDCHILWTSCTCTAVSTRVAELVDPRVCGTNDCLGRGRYPTDAVCQGNTCTTVLDPPCGADADCRVLWARCPYTDQVERDCACAAAHVSNSTTRNLVSPDGECYLVMPSTNGHATCESGYCTLVSP
jgi:hypothetical protein